MTPFGIALIVLLLPFIGIIFYVLTTTDKTQLAINFGLKDSPEYDRALQEARKIKHFFEDAVKKDGGQLLIVPYKIENLDAIDWDHEQRSSLIYFRVRLEFGYNAYIEMLQNPNLSKEEAAEFEKLYLYHTYRKSWEEIKNLGIDPSSLIYDIERGGDLLEGILYYPFYCPASGSRRNKFIDKI